MADTIVARPYRCVVKATYPIVQVGYITQYQSLHDFRDSKDGMTPQSFPPKEEMTPLGIE